MEAGAVQRAGNGAGQLEVFCRHADSSSGGSDCRHRPWVSLGRANVDRAAAKRLVGDRLVHPCGGAGRVNDQYDPVLQFQRHSLGPKAALTRDRASLPPGGSHLALLGVRANDHSLHVHAGGCDPASHPLLPASPGFADRVIHAIA